MIVESGKRYIRKDGEITGILIHPNLVDIIHNIEYYEDGSHDPDDNCADLLCEYSKEIHDIVKENIALKQDIKCEIKIKNDTVYSLQTKYNDDIKLLKSTIISQIEDRDSMSKEMDRMKEYMDDKISRIALTLLSSKQDIDEGSIYKAFNDAQLFLAIKDQIDND